MNIDTIHHFLQNVGLTEKETLIYIALLELGPQAASVVAKKTRTPRSSTFAHLDQLIKKGFVKREIRAKMQYFRAISPDNLKHLLKRNQQRAESHVKALEGLLPDLNSLCSTFSPGSKVTYFEGVEGVCKMIDLITKNDEPIYFISAHRFHPEVQQYIREHYVPKRKKKKNKSQMIIANHEDAQNYVEQYAREYCDWVHFVDEKEANFNCTIAIYGNYIQFLSTKPEDLTGVLIENSYLAQTMNLNISLS